MKYVKVICLLLCLLGYSRGYGQQFYRITGKLFIKDAGHDQNKSIVAGKFYYDLNHKKLIYDFTFPRKEKIVCIDTLNYKFVEGVYTGREFAITVPESSLFHLALLGSMADFGLKDSFYSISDVSKEGDLIISTWVPPLEAANGFGKVVVSQKNKRLHGVAIFDYKGKLLNKQIVKGYHKVQGLDFPSEILYIYYVDGKESYRAISFRDVLVNDYGEENMYNYPLPK
jgi:hypothetical protein